MIYSPIKPSDRYSNHRTDKCSTALPHFRFTHHTEQERLNVKSFIQLNSLKNSKNENNHDIVPKGDGLRLRERNASKEIHPPLRYTSKGYMEKLYDSFQQRGIGVFSVIKIINFSFLE